VHAQLELLLEIQDLQTQRQGMEDGSLADVESGVFAVEIGDAIVILDEKVEELKERLNEEIRERYRRMAAKGMRAVSPVLNGICYGCFMAVATARAAEAGRNSRVENCEHCGRFLYHVD
jgi:predicted  nucleic acid-binding Zn-ribbon protein